MWPNLRLKCRTTRCCDNTYNRLTRCRLESQFRKSDQKHSRPAESQRQEQHEETRPSSEAEVRYSYLLTKKQWNTGAPLSSGRAPPASIRSDTQRPTSATFAVQDLGGAHNELPAPGANWTQLQLFGHSLLREHACVQKKPRSRSGVTWMHEPDLHALLPETVQSSPMSLVGEAVSSNWRSPKAGEGSFELELPHPAAQPSRTVSINRFM
jgi:hypothetical protein